MVDWAWATQGAPWLDTAYWIIWFIAAGHTPASAERRAAEIPSWHTATAEGITSLADLWSDISNADPGPVDPTPRNRRQRLARTPRNRTMHPGEPSTRPAALATPG